uniref:MARVEL domain-containing protein n=1 Tax=Ditylenchus dipsaci TaxID=166011 RepID=A0A915CUY6_9BILA
MRGNSYYNFVTQTSTEWQALVLVITISFAFCALFLLLTVFFANTSYCWRQTDAIISVFGTVLYILATSLEIYYAACYPPIGQRINLVCYRPEWIMAGCLSFINLIVYIAYISFKDRS